MFRLDSSNLNLDKIGGKASSLNKLFLLGNINVPQGFVLSSEIYNLFLEFNNLQFDLKTNLNITEIQNLSENIKEQFKNSRFPNHIEEKIYQYYDDMNGEDVAVRSSAIGEDGLENSFAGQQDTYLNVNREKLVRSIIDCYASLFNVSAISYRISRNLLNFEMAVVVQKMVRAEKSGVAFSIDTETGFDKVVIINSNYGLGESVVSGEIEPDEYIFFKPTETIISKKKGSKQKKTVYSDNNTELIYTNEKERGNFSLNEDEAYELGMTVIKLEEKYGFPIDVEFAFSDKLYILQVRPETTIKKVNVIQKYSLNTKEIPILTGTAVGQKISTGTVNIKDKIDGDFQKGDILVARITSPDFEPFLRLAAGVITETGGRTCHAAIVARELGIPAIVGCVGCLDKLQNGEEITLSCVSEIGEVYSGKIEYQIDEIDISDVYEKAKHLPVSLKINAGFPDSAFSTAYLPTNGVGLTRLEFIISNIGVHPRALLEYDTLPDDLRVEIDGIVGSFEDENEDEKFDKRINYYIDGISNGVSKIAASVYPNEVIVRFSDFKTNEYRNLLGGYLFEPDEENPQIGFRGACRYYSKEFSESFKLECMAIENVRNKKMLKNVAVMIPFCRTIEELLKVKAIIKQFELSDIKLYLMCEIPSNVILAEEFAEHIDGFSIGSNDLTQLTLGIDRDNSSIKHIGDERNPAVKKLIQKVIKKAHKKGITVGICGTAPSDHKEFAKFLVESGIDSISVTPDVFVETVNKLSKL